jgi:hypothetical protein
MIDTFHANIEDPDVAGAARAAGRLLAHIHVADSNRQGVGRGHVDFGRLLRALVEIGYDGALVLEPLPPLANPYEAMAGRPAMDVAERFARESLALLRLYEATARWSWNRCRRSPTHMRRWPGGPPWTLLSDSPARAWHCCGCMRRRRAPQEALECPRRCSSLARPW